MVDVTAHHAAQPSVKHCKTRESLRAPRTARQQATSPDRRRRGRQHRQRRLDIIDEQ